MPRITPDQMVAVVARTRRAMVTAGMIDSLTQLNLDWGSKSNGISFELWVGSPVTRHEYRPFPFLHLGRTSNQCYDALHNLASTIEAVNESWSKKTRSLLTESPTSTGGSTFRQEYPDATSAV